MLVYLSMFAVLCVVYAFHYIQCSEFESTPGSRYIKHTHVNKHVSASRFSAFIIFGYIIFWTGSRNAYVDTAAYIRGFSKASIDSLTSLNFSLRSGVGFTIIEALFKEFISDNYHAWLMFLAAVSGFCIAHTFRKYSSNFFFSVFMFLALTTFTWLMNGIRQFLAVTLLFACTPLIEKRKTIPYCLAVLLCCTIHATAIIMLPVYFLSQRKPWGTITLLLLAGVALICVFVARFTGLLESVLKDTSYANITDQFANDDGVNPLRVIVYAVPTVLAFLQRNNDHERKDKMHAVFVNMSILTTSIYFIGMFTSGILVGRLPMYMQLYQYILLPDLLNKYEGNNRRIVYAVSIIGYIAFFFMVSRGIYYSNDLVGRI